MCEGFGHTGKNAVFASAQTFLCNPTGAPGGPQGRAGQGGDLLKCFQELCPAQECYRDTDETGDLLPSSREDLACSVAAWIRKCVLDSME